MIISKFKQGSNNYYLQINSNNRNYIYKNGSINFVNLFDLGSYLKFYYLAALFVQIIIAFA